MTSVNVGDAVVVTYTAPTGTTVTAAWLDPDLATVFDSVPVTENPTGSGAFPFTVRPARPGTWTLRFTSPDDTENFFVRASAISGPPPLAVLSDVATQYGSLTPNQVALTTWLIQAASKMVRARFPAIDTHLAGGLLDPEVVALGISNMVLRVLRNPKGLRGESTGPFGKTYDVPTSRTRTGAQPSSAGQLTIGDNEIELFTPTSLRNVLNFGVGSIKMQAGLAPWPYGVHYGLPEDPLLTANEAGDCEPMQDWRDG